MTTAWTVRAMLWAASLVLWDMNAQSAANASDAAPARQMEIVLEQLQHGSWVVVNPATVFDSGAEVRFRVRTNFAAHLFVNYVGSSGSSAVLFPNVETGRNNRLEPGVSRLLPETDGVFRLGGPAGVDILHWVAVPVPSGVLETPGYEPLPAPPSPGTMLHTLVPRCDDAMFRGTEPCRETRAPARGVRTGVPVTENRGIAGSFQARDIDFARRPAAENAGKTLVRAGSGAGVVVYEMRIVHR